MYRKLCTQARVGNAFLSNKHRNTKKENIKPHTMHFISLQNVKLLFKKATLTNKCTMSYFIYTIYYILRKTKYSTYSKIQTIILYLDIYTFKFKKKTPLKHSGA